MSTSWMDLPADHPFGLTALPYGVFSTDDPDLRRVGVRIGDHVLDAGVAAEHAGMESGACWTQPTLNDFLSRGPHAWAAARAWLTEVLTDPAHRDAVEPHLLPLVRRHDAPAVRGGRLRRLLRQRAARHQRRPDLPPGRRGADAELEAPADRLPRPRRHRRGERHRHRPAQRPAQGPCRGGTGLRPERAARHRGRAGLRRRRRDRPGLPGRRRRGRRPPVRGRAAQRLERPRHPGVGVRPARPVPGQVLRHQHLRLGAADGGAERGPGRAARPGPRAAALPARGDRRARRTAWTSTARCGSTAPWSRARTTPTCTGHPPRCWPTSA